MGLSGFFGGIGADDTGERAGRGLQHAGDTGGRGLQQADDLAGVGVFRLHLLEPLIGEKRRYRGALPTLVAMNTRSRMFLTAWPTTFSVP